MKKLTFNLFLMLTSLVVVSCDPDSDNDDRVNENSYTFGYTISVRDINGRNLLNKTTRKEHFSIDEVMIETLSDKDKVTSKISTNGAEHIMDIKIKSFDTESVLTHLQVLKWEYENGTVTDTILCEIEKTGSTIICKKIWVNNHLKWDHVTSNMTPWFILTKISPEYISLRDDKSSDSRVETVIDGIKFAFWLSDMDENETNIFDRNDVEKRGFNFNLSVTNNTNEIISFDNDALAPFLGYVFDPERNEGMRTCVIFEDILIIHEVKPRETHYVKLWWCNSIDNFKDNQLLSPGKYYTYFFKEKFKINTPSQKEVNISPMFINLEIK